MRCRKNPNLINHLDNFANKTLPWPKQIYNVMPPGIIQRRKDLHIILVRSSQILYCYITWGPTLPIELSFEKKNMKFTKFTKF